MSFERALDRALAVLRRRKRKPARVQQANDYARRLLTASSEGERDLVRAEFGAPRGGKARHAAAETRVVWRDPRNPKGRGFAAWVRALKGKSGAYLIRSKTTGEYVYAGESHTGNLSRTLVRHFYASWDRKRRGKHPFNRAEGGEVPGYLYDRDRHEVRVQVTAPSEAAALQYEWINKFDPRDNRVYGDTVPF